MKGGEIRMMKNRNVLILLLIAFCSISICFTLGCAKKSTVREEPAEPVIEEEPVEPTPAEEPVKPPKEEATKPIVEPKQITFRKIYFDFDKYNLRNDARMALDVNVKILKENPDIILMVEGHCDERGTIEYNLQLGKKRAESAKDYITASGIDSYRLKTISFGEEKPLDFGHTEKAWAKNRRADSKILNR